VLKKERRKEKEGKREGESKQGGGKKYKKGEGANKESDGCTYDPGRDGKQINEWKGSGEKDVEVDKKKKIAQIQGLYGAKTTIKLAKENNKRGNDL